MRETVAQPFLSWLMRSGGKDHLPSQNVPIVKHLRARAKRSGSYSARAGSVGTICGQRRRLPRRSEESSELHSAIDVVPQGLSVPRCGPPGPDAYSAGRRARAHLALLAGTGPHRYSTGDGRPGDAGKPGSVSSRRGPVEDLT